MDSSRVSGEYVMKKIFSNKYLSAAFRIALGALFVYASMDKIANPPDFLKIIQNYRVLPAALENPLAIFLPWLELITGIFLITGKFERASLIVYSALLLIFIFALAQAKVRGLDIACGCFSVKSSSSSEVWGRIIMDIVMLFFSLNLYFSIPESEKERININNQS